MSDVTPLWDDAAVEAALATATPLFAITLPDDAGYTVYALADGPSVVVWADGSWAPYAEARQAGLPPIYTMTRIPLGTPTPPTLAAARQDGQEAGDTMRLYTATIEGSSRHPQILYNATQHRSWVGEATGYEVFADFPDQALHAWMVAQAFPYVAPSDNPPDALIPVTDRLTLVRTLPWELLAAFYAAEEHAEPVLFYRLALAQHTPPSWVGWFPTQQRFAVHAAGTTTWTAAHQLPADLSPFLPPAENRPGAGALGAVERA